MDLVLGLSITSADVRWVLVEGATAEGATVCRDGADFDTLDDVIAAVGDSRLHAVGVTWANDAESAASTLIDALSDRGLGDVIRVSQQEAAESLAMGIADRGGYGALAVCIVESDGGLVVLVDHDGVSADRVEPAGEAMLALLDSRGFEPEAIFVLGSVDNVDSIAASFHGAGVPVLTASEADLALARGTALASASAVNSLAEPQHRWRMPSRVGALTSVVAAAAVIFIVSLSVALSLNLTPDRDSAVAHRDTATTLDEPVTATTAPSAAQAAPQRVTVLPAPPPPSGPVLARKIEVAAAPAPEAAPVVEPPAAPPAYVPPPAAPAYVPPAPPQPRLRDRIIERIPIINRFHEPQYPHG